MRASSFNRDKDTIFRKYLSLNDHSSKNPALWNQEKTVLKVDKQSIKDWTFFALHDSWDMVHEISHETCIKYEMSQYYCIKLLWWNLERTGGTRRSGTVEEMRRCCLGKFWGEKKWSSSKMLRYTYCCLGKVFIWTVWTMKCQVALGNQMELCNKRSKELGEGVNELKKQQKWTKKTSKDWA